MNTNTVSISIVVPVYNGQNYLLDCLDSIASQSFQDFEVWVINDGSTDSSGEIAETFTKKDSRFHLLSQENKGLSGARNAGIAMCSGEYIAFVDSDDRIRRDYLLKLYSTAKEQQADIVCCNFAQYFPQTGRTKNCVLHMPTGTYDGTSAIHFLIRDVLMRNYVWNKLWKRELFIHHNIRFTPMRYEDMTIGPELFLYASRVAVIPDVLYDYSQRWGSMSLQIDEAGLNDYVRTFGYRRIFFEEHDVYQKFRGSMQFFKYKNYPFTFGWLVLLHLKKRQLRTLPKNWTRMSRFFSYFSSGHPIDSSVAHSLLHEPVCMIEKVKDNGEVIA